MGRQPEPAGCEGVMANRTRNTGRQGRVPDSWRMVRLGEVVSFQQGGTPSKSRSEYWDGDIPFVTGADLREIRISRGNTPSFLTNEGLHSGATVTCKEGALLLATRIRVGIVGIANELMGASQDFMLLTPNDGTDQSFLCRVLIQQSSRFRLLMGFAAR